MLVSDNKILKIWDLENSSENSVWASVEPPTDINDVLLVPNSGLILMALEQPKLHSYYIPNLGPAPRWASFVENITEELEENSANLYSDYKFITREEVVK